MSKLLGEVLLQAEIISREQLKEALGAQLIYGGHLGTCLIELGHIGEEILGQVLAETFRVKYAQPKHFENVAHHVIEILPQHLVKRHRAVPVDLKDNILHVAMTDPRNLSALDEISFVSGYRVVPWVSPEVRIVHAMERYYRIQRPLRYIALSRSLDRERTRLEAPARQETPPRSPAPSVPSGQGQPIAAQGQQSESQLSAGNLVASLVDASAPYPTVSKAGNPATVTRIIQISDRPEEAGALQPWEFISDQGEVEQPATREHDVAAEPFAEKLCRAETKEDLLELVLDHAALRLSHCLLFLVKRENAVAFASRGLSADVVQSLGGKPAALKQIFELLREGIGYRGPVPDDNRYQGLYHPLEIEYPGDILILPVYLKKSLVALFYGDVGPGKTIPDVTESYSSILEKFAMALHVILLKRKIRLP